MRAKYSVTALCSMGTLDGIVVEKKLNGKSQKTIINRDEVTYAAIAYAEDQNLFNF